MSKTIKSKKVKLSRKKLNLPKGVKLTHPLEVTVSLVEEMRDLYDVHVSGNLLIPDTKLVYLGSLEKTRREYKKLIRRLRQGDYNLQTHLSARISIY